MERRSPIRDITNAMDRSREDRARWSLGLLVVLR